MGDTNSRSATEHQQHTTKTILLQIKMESFKGNYTRVSADQYEEALKALDVNVLLRKAALVSTPVMKVTEVDGIWSIKSSTTLKTIELKFKIGETFEEITPDGREVEAIVTHEGNKLISIQKAKKPGQKSTKVIREFNGDEVVQTMTFIGSDEGIVCVQKFKRN